jgi:LmbE family N-acetylglucosaminyl deacetylase
MVEAPLTFFEVKEETILAHAAQFEESEFSVTPKNLWDPFSLAGCVFGFLQKKRAFRSFQPRTFWEGVCTFAEAG